MQLYGGENLFFATFLLLNSIISIITYLFIDYEYQICKLDSTYENVYNLYKRNKSYRFIFYTV